MKYESLDFQAHLNNVDTIKQYNLTKAFNGADNSAFNQNPLSSINENSIFAYNENKANNPNWVDGVYNGANNVIDAITPNFAYQWIPKGILLQTESKYDFTIDNKLAFESLPRTQDGELDVDKIQASLETSLNLISEQNKEAIEMLDYGIYKDAINNTNLMVALLGPEVANVVTSLGGDSIPDWATEGISLFDLDLNTLLTIFEEAGINLSDYGIDDIVDFLDIKTSHEIIDEIKTQEEGFAELKNFEIKSDEDAKEFLDKYLALTGTSFFCENIDECQKLYENEDSSEKDKIKAYQKACGNSNALVDAQKNQIMTNICYDVGIKYVVPTIINKIETIPTKIISTALPTVIEATEVATQGRKDGEVINLRNLDYKSVVNILAEGGIDGLMVNVGPMLGYSDKFIKKVAGKSVKTGAVQVANLASKAAVKAVVPNYSSWWKAAITFLIPGSGLFFDW